MATVGTLGVMLAIPTLLNFKAPLNSYRPKSSTPNISSLQNKEEQYMYMYMYNQRRALINESSMIDMGFAEKEALPSRFMQHYFGNEIQILKSWRDVSSWNETERGVYLREFANPTQHGHGDLFYGGLCDTILVFRATNGVRRHVLISHLNENWGAFSTHVPNRTVDWGNWDSHFKAAGCTTDDLWWYLNHTNVSAVFTVTHQWLDHPKALSLPLGVTTSAKAKLSQELTLQGTITRIANFNGSIRNRYKDGSDYLQNLQNSKFTLCPGGLGWDTYRAWESMVMGSIPVLETYYRKDGFYRVFDDLPVLWVDHFDNVTPALLESSYPKILARAEEYNFAKLTKHWWVDYINSFRFDFPAKKRNPQMNMTVSGHSYSNSSLNAWEYKVKVSNYNPDFSWMNTIGNALSLVEGNPDVCTDVIYTADTRLPQQVNRTITDASWDSLSIISRLPLFNKTCFAFFHISDEHYQPEVGLHPVWGRIPAQLL
eukprot:scaffold3705_cov159-Skeletonema_marinoi.AAC.1